MYKNLLIFIDSLKLNYKGNKNVTGKVIEYFPRQFSYALKQGKDNQEKEMTSNKHTDLSKAK